MAGLVQPRAAHPGGAFGDYPRTSALDAPVKPCMTKLKGSAYFWALP
jgi:hypothetical protein